MVTIELKQIVLVSLRLFLAVKFVFNLILATAMWAGGEMDFEPCTPGSGVQSSNHCTT